jgi:predicted KAP-like P-loop ATPase
MTDETHEADDNIDRPITSRNQDRLGRAGFASAIADAIAAWTAGDSLVIGLTGPWGSGKSSIKNMVVEIIREHHGPNVGVVDFNPWRYSGIVPIHDSFLRELGQALRKGLDWRDARRLAAKWRSYSRLLSTGSEFATAVAGAVRGGLIIAAPTLWVLGYFLTSSARWTAVIVGSLLAGLAALMKGSVKVADFIASLLEARFVQGDESRESVKKEIENGLSGRKGPIAIFVDDVDRLTAAEIQQMFQLIKSNLDFPKTVYVLMFDRGQVESALSDLSQGQGRHFLQKIIQVPFDVPAADQSAIDKVLTDGLDAMLGDIAIAETFDRHRWGNLFVGSLRHFFSSLRHVKTYLATLRLNVGLLNRDGVFEVNIVDLIGMEALRVFEPDVHRRLSKLKEYLAPHAVMGRPTAAQEKTIKETLENLVGGASPPNQQSVKELIKQLFPPVEWAFDGSHYVADFQEGWLKDRRICSHDMFDRYFQLEIPTSDLPVGSIKALLRVVNDRDAAKAILREHAERGSLKTLIQRLEAYTDDVPLEHANNFVTAIFDAGEDLPAYDRGFFEIGYDMQACRLVYHVLKRHEDPAWRGRALLASVKQTTGLFVPIKQISLEEGHEKEDAKRSLVTAEDLGVLKEEGLRLIREAAAAGRLLSHPRLAYLLYRWGQWGSFDDAKEWVAETVVDRQSAVQFIQGFLQRGSSAGIGDHVARTRWSVPLKEIEDFVDSARLEDLLQGKASGPDAEEATMAIAAYRRAVKRRREGRGDRPSPWDEND